jgi:preprotein translocase subunit SecA
VARSVSDGPTAGRLVAKGIDGPEQRTPLQYSAPSVDGDGGVITRGDAGSRSGGARPAAAGDDGATNREARRKAAKQQRKR